MSIRTKASRSRKALAMTGLGSLLVAVGVAGLGPDPANSSSHREAPLIAGLPQYDTTDVYAFRSPDRPNSITLIANWIPFEEPAGGPNFYSFATDARYNIKVDNDGDTLPDVTFRWTFKDHYVSDNTFLYATGPVTSLRDENLNFFQTYRLERIANGETKVLVRSRRVVPSDVGDGSMPNYASLRNAGVKEAGPGGRYRTFAGQAEDPFFVDLRVFDLLYGGDFSESGDDTLAGFNVNSVALQVPRDALAERGDFDANPIIGVWSTTDRRGVDGRYRQVSRLGMPLVNEVVIPLKDKNRFNASAPRNDGQFLDYVTHPELPQLIEAVYGVDAPAEPRNDLVSVFLTGVEGLNMPDGVTPSEQLRLNMTVPVTADPDPLGVLGGDNQGFPNGRRLTDDVIDIALQVVEGELVGSPNDLADGVSTNDVAFLDTFPYLALPHSGSDGVPHPATAPSPKDQQETGDSLLEDMRQNGVLPLMFIGTGGGGLLAGAVLMVRASRRPTPQPA